MDYGKDKQQWKSKYKTQKCYRDVNMFQSDILLEDSENDSKTS